MDLIGHTFPTLNPPAKQYPRIEISPGCGIFLVYDLISPMGVLRHFENADGTVRGDTPEEVRRKLKEPQLVDVLLIPVSIPAADGVFTLTAITSPDLRQTYQGSAEEEKWRPTGIYLQIIEHFVGFAVMARLDPATGQTYPPLEIPNAG